MRALTTIAALGCGLLVACSNDVDPRVIPGGGVGDGEIDGEVNVSVIDSLTDAPIAGAKVSIGETEKTTDAKGFAVFADVEGAQTIAVLASGYRAGVWVGVNGANVTVPVQPLTGAPEQATLAGAIAGWSAITVPQGHVKAAFVLYSQTDLFGDRANSIATPSNANVCVAGAECSWSVNTRTGTVTLAAVIVDRDAHGTLDPADDTNTVIGYAYKSGIEVAGGVDQSGLVLDLVEAGNLESITIDEGTPPAGLPDVVAIPGIELSAHEVLQLPLFFLTSANPVLLPKRSVFGAAATYRLTAVAQTPAGAAGAQSILLRQRLTDTTLAAGTWLIPPVNVTATRTSASFEPVAGARAHSAVWRDEMGDDLLEITVFDAKTKVLEVPSAVSLPASGTLSARVNAIGADFDPNDFSLEDDSASLWGIAAQPTPIP